MVGQDFIFNNKRLSDFGFIMAKPNDNNSNSGLTREIVKGTVTPEKSKVNFFGTTYTDVIILPFLIVKNVCDSSLGNQITPFELRKIQSWLTYSQLPQTLKIEDKDGGLIEYCGIFTEIVPYEYDGLNGLSLMFTCDSPFAYNTKEIIVDNRGNISIEKNVFNDTDENLEYIYPVITFNPSTNGMIQLTNMNDNNNYMKMSFASFYNEIIIDCQLKRIIADGKVLSLSDVGFNINEITDYNNVNTGIFSMYWLRLIKGQNIISFVGNGVFKIKYKELLKLGGLVYV